MSQPIFAPDWAAALAPVMPNINAMGTWLNTIDPANYAPAKANIFKAFSRPMADVKVLIIGQDPYPTPGHAMGLSFSVAPDVSPIPKSLQNIYSELESDLNIPAPSNGDLTGWFERGVMLLNGTLTVGIGKPGSHRGQGWETITLRAIYELAQAHQNNAQPLVAILWGKHAQAYQPGLESCGVPCITSSHPSPLSAYRGFIGSRPFSRANALLQEQGADPVDWQLP